MHPPPPPPQQYNANTKMWHQVAQFFFCDMYDYGLTVIYTM